MPCEITIDTVNGINPNPDDYVQLVEVRGTSNCEKVTVCMIIETSPSTEPMCETVFVENGEYIAPFNNFKPRIKCDTEVVVHSFCTENPECEFKDKFNIVCITRTEKPRYVTYYDCSGWNSTVEVMNIQPFPASFKITNYSRDGQLYWQYIRNPNAHETIQISLDRKSPTHEGLVVVSPVEDGHEFPSVLIIGEQPKVSRVFPDLEIYEPVDKNVILEWLKSLKKSLRFVPFTRIP